MADQTPAQADDVASSETPEEEDEKQEIMSLRIFETLELAQSSHGIPSQDYAQYRHYCTNRLDRIRHHREVRSVLTHNPKYCDGVSGHRNVFCPRQVVPDIVSHEYVVWNILFQSERAWAHACSVQKDPQEIKKHATAQRRLNKAVKWASRLVEIAKKCTDERTIKEAESYLAWMEGNAALEAKKYATAYRSYRDSRAILLALVADIPSGATDASQLAVSDLWTTRADTVIKPLMRFSQLEARDLDPNEIEQDGGTPHTTSKSGSAENSIILEFRNREIALDPYPQIAVLYLKMEERLQAKHLSEDEFVQLLTDLDDASKLAAAETNRYRNLPAGPAVKAKRIDLSTLQSFFTYHQLQLQRRQQEERVANLTDDAEIVHVYDALQQCVQAMTDLPADEDAEDDEDDPHWLEAQAHLLRIRAFRCYHLSRLHESEPGLLNSTPRHVLALLKQSSQLQRRAAEEVAACEMDSGDDYLQALEGLKSNIQAMQCRVEATLFLESTNVGSVSGGMRTDRPLWLRMYDLDSGQTTTMDSLVDRPPRLVPMPLKPVFYDLAYDYALSASGENADLQVLEECIAANEPREEEAQPTGGLFGWFGR